VLPVVFATYLAVCVIARLGYRFVLYPAPSDPTIDLGRGATLLTARAADGTTVRALRFAPATADARTIVVFHGNGETASNRMDLAENLHARGFGVVLVEYRGYGMSQADGPSTEQGLYLDASAILDALRADHIDRDRTVLLGISLGTGVAAEMARTGLAASLVLVSPYTSITAMARRVAPILPASWIVADKFDTLSKASAIRVPTLIVHGDRDEVVPFAMGEKVAKAITGAKLHIVRGGHHNDVLEATGVLGAIAEFVGH
jgi:pimeloyl-ACP methyl ester carboxylesterase